MKIAVTYEDGNVFPHFGRTPAFKLYQVENSSVVKSEVINTNGTGHGALAGFLVNLGAEVLICGGMGAGAVAAMNEAGIKIYAGADGSADDAVKAYLNGTLAENGEATCDHHDHEGHGDHDCGHGGCHH